MRGKIVTDQRVIDVCVSLRNNKVLDPPSTEKQLNKTYGKKEDKKS